jgi:hypothetical protein
MPRAGGLPKIPRGWTVDRGVVREMPYIREPGTLLSRPRYAPQRCPLVPTLWSSRADIQDYSSGRTDIITYIFFASRGLFLAYSMVWIEPVEPL